MVDSRRGFISSRVSYIGPDEESLGLPEGLVVGTVRKLDGGTLNLAEEG